MPETFLNKAQLTGLSADARRTEILRAKREAALEARIVELEALTAPTAWTALTYSNGWTNTASQQNGQYRKVGDIVYVRGYLTAGTWGVQAFTLPVGFRPPGNLDLPVASWTGSAPSAAHMYIQTGGSVLFQRTTGNFASFSIQFSTTA